MKTIVLNQKRKSFLVQTRNWYNVSAKRGHIITIYQVLKIAFLGKVKYQVPQTRATTFAPILTRYLKLDPCRSSSFDLPNKLDSLISKYPVISTEATIVFFSNTSIRLQKPFRDWTWVRHRIRSYLHLACPFSFPIYISYTINMDVVHAFTMLFSAVLNMLNNSMGV